MNHKIWEIKNILNDNEKEHIEKYILSNDFPWYFQPVSTTEKFLFFSHMLMPRADDPMVTDFKKSDEFSFFENILLRACDAVNLKIKTMMRGCLNLNVNCFDYKHGDPHIDFKMPHKLGIIYLNDCEGDTHIFKQTYKDIDFKNSTMSIDEHIKNPLDLFKTIKPEKYKVLIFDGKHYHATSYPAKNDRRVIAVFNFQTEDDYGETSDKK